MNKNVEEFAPKPAETVGALRNATENTFAEDFPETKKLEALLRERLREIEQKEVQILQQAKDIRQAKEHVMTALDAIQGDKKP